MPSEPRPRQPTFVEPPVQTMVEHRTGALSGRGDEDAMVGGSTLVIAMILIMGGMVVGFGNGVLRRCSSGSTKW